jgi:hypothetical protein
MKKNQLSVPFSLAATAAVVLACAAGCAKKNSADMPAATAEPLPAESALTNAVITNAISANVTSTTPATNLNTAGTIMENVPADTEPATVTLPEEPTTPEPAPTAPAVEPEKHKVEMPATAPTAPTNFYSADFATNNSSPTPTTIENYYFRLRGGYEHTSHGDNNDTFYLSIKFYANGKDLRDRAGKNAWLVPDADAEFSHQYLPKPDGGSATGSEEGVELRASFFWPWANWTMRTMSHTNSSCPFSGPLTFGLGPTFNIGFDKLFDHTDTRLNRYFGARLTFNHDGFVEVTGGATDGLQGTRAQVLGELPVFTSHDHEISYVLRGLWNTGGNSSPDVFQGGFFVEMPFDFLVKPAKWNDLNPFKE